MIMYEDKTQYSTDRMVDGAPRQHQEHTDWAKAQTRLCCCYSPQARYLGPHVTFGASTNACRAACCLAIERAWWEAASKISHIERTGAECGIYFGEQELRIQRAQTKGNDSTYYPVSMIEEA
jgi:hypothetical protein